MPEIKTGILYRKADYPGVFYRMLIDGIDISLASHLRMYPHAPPENTSRLAELSRFWVWKTRTEESWRQS